MGRRAQGQGRLPSPGLGILAPVGRSRVPAGGATHAAFVPRAGDDAGAAMGRQDAGATEKALLLRVGVSTRAAMGRQDAGATKGALRLSVAFASLPLEMV